jgi:hypothetical protein
MPRYGNDFRPYDAPYGRGRDIRVERVRGGHRGYDRHHGGWGMADLHNRIMYGYGRDYERAPRRGAPAGPSHNWGQGELGRVRGGYHRGRYEGLEPRGRYDAGWMY